MNAWPHRWRVRRHIPKFLRACPEPFRGEVLEIGAGRGWTSRQILDTFPQVELTATDIDRYATAVFHQLENKYGRRLKTREANVLKLPFDRESFDIVLAINVMPYLKPFRVRKAIHEMLRVLRLGGLLGISVETFLSLPHPGSRPFIEEVLAEETCSVLYAKGDRRYMLWARKPYPIEPPAQQI